MNKGNWKKHLVLTSLVISGLILTGCSELSIDPSTSSSDSSSKTSSTNKTNKSESNNDTSDTSVDKQSYSDKWTSGLPKKYQGFYSRYEEYVGDKQYTAVVFSGNTMSYGLGDKMIFDNTEYKQLDKNTFIIHGTDNHYSQEHPDVYAKVTFKVKNGTTYFGLVGAQYDGSVGDSDGDINSYEKTYNQKMKNIAWYRKDTKGNYQKQTGDTTNYDDNDNTKSKDSSSSDMKYTITSKEGKKYKSNYTIQQMRDKYNLKQSKTREDGYEKVENLYEGTILEDPIIHDGSSEETHAEGSLQLSGNWAMFTNKLYDGGNATDNILINLETGEKEEDIA